MMPPWRVQQQGVFGLRDGDRRELSGEGEVEKRGGVRAVTMISAMWERSKIPAAARTAWCSARSLVYRTGICQPAKSVKLAPASRWT